MFNNSCYKHIIFWSRSIKSKQVYLTWCLPQPLETGWVLWWLLRGFLTSLCKWLWHLIGMSFWGIILQAYMQSVPSSLLYTGISQEDIEEVARKRAAWIILIPLQHSQSMGQKIADKWILFPTGLQVIKRIFRQSQKMWFNLCYHGLPLTHQPPLDKVYWLKKRSENTS